MRTQANIPMFNTGQRTTVESRMPSAYMALSIMLMPTLFLSLGLLANTVSSYAVENVHGEFQMPDGHCDAEAIFLLHEKFVFHLQLAMPLQGFSPLVIG